MPNQSNEEMLTGGNVSNVYRAGNNVRREMKPESDRIHLLLKHLENKGFSYSPRFLGVDEKGREILSYIEGEAGHYPLMSYMWSDEVLTKIAKMQRAYHEAVSDFPIPADWEPLDNTPNQVDVLCHNDFAMYNIIFNEEKPVGLIDFDVAAPGPRIWDIAYTLYTCVPLSRFILSEQGEKVDYDTKKHASVIKQRIHLFFEAYGEIVPDNIFEIVIRRLEALCTTMKRKAAEGDNAFLKMIKEGHLDHYQDDILFINHFSKEWK
ncbi:phosphotransferase [Bacillus alkalicellulosilyticus]|uniref:phosphotransferase n=1 Tax=Alkalihalobacterium alkalicellulosilyticum TaxID=1912214 RepID=UPI0009960C61|nr:phosphotransferase [Bacillus alkalicellulosilyticus]